MPDRLDLVRNIWHAKPYVSRQYTAGRPSARRYDVKKAVTFRFDPDLLEQAKSHASADNRTLTNFVETAMLRAIEGSDPKPPRRDRRAIRPAGSN